MNHSILALAVFAVPAVSASAPPNRNKGDDR
jgi:hypothetical protein